MNLRNRNARMAGLLYLLVVLIAPYRLVYLPSTLFVDGDAAATVANIAAHETLFRFGMLSDLVVGCLQVFLALALYRLFRDVDRRQAVLLVILGGVLQCALFFFNVFNDAAALMLVHGGGYLSAIDAAQRNALAMLFLHLHGANVGAAEMLWGLWLFPMALLVLRSGFLPRLFGYWLILNGLAYVIQSIAWAVLPQWQDMLSSLLGPLQFVEVLFMLWLLAMGARPGFRRVHGDWVAPAAS